MAQKQPGTGNFGQKTAGNREHWPENSREQGTSYPPIPSLSCDNKNHTVSGGKRFKENLINSSRASSYEVKSKTQGPRNIGSKTAGNLEHWLKNSREPGTMALKALGTGNICLKIAGNRKQSMKSNVEITSPSTKEL